MQLLFRCSCLDGCGVTKEPHKGSQSLPLIAWHRRYAESLIMAHTWLQLPGAAQRSTTRVTPATTSELTGDQLTAACQRRQVAGLRLPSLPTLQDLELVVYLQELESTASPPALLLCFSIVYVTFVFGGATHPEATLAGYIRASGRPSKAVHSACSASQGSDQSRVC